MWKSNTIKACKWKIETAIFQSNNNFCGRSLRGPYGSLLCVCHLCSGLSKQHTGLLIFERIGWGGDAGEQRVTPSVLLTVPDQVCCCQGDLMGKEVDRLQNFFFYVNNKGIQSQTFWTWEISRNVIFCGISIYRWFQVMHTLILSMFASTRSWSTSFCAWTTLLLLHIFPDIAFNMNKDSNWWHYPCSAERATQDWCVLPDPNSQRKRDCAGGSSEKIPSFLFCQHPSLYSLLGSVQRLCDIKGHTAQCWKCHRHHTSLHSHHWED